MNSMSTSMASATSDIAASAPVRPADHWQRRFGVPWDRVDRAARAVLDRAIAASNRKFAAFRAQDPAAEARPS